MAEPQGRQLIPARDFVGKNLVPVSRSNSFSLTSLERRSAGVPRLALGSQEGIPAAILHKAVAQKVSGHLTICDPSDASISWRVFLSDGNVHFADSNMGCQERYSYLLSRYLPTLQTGPLLTHLKTSYSTLLDLCLSQGLPLKNLQWFLAAATQEALTQIVTLPKTPLRYASHFDLDPILLSDSYWSLMDTISDRTIQWSALRPDICSPFQRLHLQDRKQLLRYAGPIAEQCPNIESLGCLLEQDLCLYELATQLHLDIDCLAALLHPFIKCGAVRTASYRSHRQRPVVACVNNSKMIQTFAKRVLESSGYKVLSLMHPDEVLPTLLKHRPALTLVDVDLPQMDGYRLCRLLRQSSTLRHLPIVMMTAGGLRNTLRLHLSGATAAITKPFRPQELISLVHRLAPGGSQGWPAEAA